MIHLCYRARTFVCGWPRLRLAAKRGGEEAGTASQRKTKENLGKGGGDARPNPKPSDNLDLRSLKPLPKEREVGSGVKRTEAPKQQPVINSPDQSVPTEPKLTREQLLDLAGRNIAEWLDQKHQRFVEEQLRITRWKEEKSPEPTTDQEEE